MDATPALRDVLTGDLAPLMASAGSLIHAAARLDHGLGQAALAENRQGTARVMAAAREAEIAPVVHISTASVLQTDPLRQVNETTPYPARPAGSYSAGKAEAESNALAVRDAMRVMVLRPREIGSETREQPCRDRLKWSKMAVCLSHELQLPPLYRANP